MNYFVRQPAFYPVQVAFIDDSAEYLRALRRLFPDSYLNRFFIRPREALSFVRARHRDMTSHSTFRLDETESDQYGGNAIGHDILTDTSRFDQVAAVVVDYEMSEMDGISFFSAIKDVPCTKVLLTGVADESTAVDAFNHGLIDYYLKKTDPGLSQKLAATLSQAKELHCTQSGQISLGEIGLSYCDPRVVEVMKGIVADRGIVEYYWRPTQNAVLMFDRLGYPSLFLVWNENDWTSQCEVIVDSCGPHSLLDDIRARRSMPVFWPSLAFQPTMPIVRNLRPMPIPGWPGAFYGWTELDADEVDATLPTFAKWRKDEVIS
jgi:CheY-like chemotaxis protein